MLVCHCRAVYEDEVREALADGAADEVDVALYCGAGSVCGGCVPLVSQLLADARAGREPDRSAALR